MAAAALCHLKGGTPEQCAAAAAMALGNLLGLVCDLWPVWWRCLHQAQCCGCRERRFLRQYGACGGGLRHPLR